MVFNHFKGAGVEHWSRSQYLHNLLIIPVLQYSEYKKTYIPIPTCADLQNPRVTDHR